MASLATDSLADTQTREEAPSAPLEAELAAEASCGCGAVADGSTAADAPRPASTVTATCSDANRRANSAGCAVARAAAKAQVRQLPVEPAGSREGRSASHFTVRVVAEEAEGTASLTPSLQGSTPSAGRSSFAAELDGFRRGPCGDAAEPAAGGGNLFLTCLRLRVEEFGDWERALEQPRRSSSAMPRIRARGSKAGDGPSPDGAAAAAEGADAIGTSDPADAETRAPSWKEWAGREKGGAHYRPGDFVRGSTRALVKRLSKGKDVLKAEIDQQQLCQAQLEAEANEDRMGVASEPVMRRGLSRWRRGSV